MFRIARRLKSDIAFVFDIDGVLIRGKKAIPQARPTLELLKQKQIPYALLTNGGGVTESDRVKYLTQLIGFPLSPLQIVQSHTPMKVLAQDRNFKRVMVVGGNNDNARKCALEYGFQDVLMPIDLIKYNESIAPHHRYTPEELSRYALTPAELKPEIPIDAVLVFNDPRDMGTDMQVVLDLLNSEGGRIGTRRLEKSVKPSIPIIFSNNDFYWANEFNLPRFGQGAFRIVIEQLYKEMNSLNGDQVLESTIMGKPFKIQYDFTHSFLINPFTLPRLHETPSNSPFKKIYMVGDNPASDIQGANDNGWESILLRTGVYRDSDQLSAKPSVGIFDNVLEGVEFVLNTSGS